MPAPEPPFLKAGADGRWRVDLPAMPADGEKHTLRVRGDTASGATKPATVETGAVVKVPLFVDQGEMVRIDTRSGEYVSRAKD